MRSAMGYGAIALLAGSMAVIVNGGVQKSTQPNADSEGTPATVQGLVRDIACPIQNKRATSTDFNLECALQCARNGSPLIVLTDDGTIYIPISESTPDVSQRERLMPLLGKRARVTGSVYERAGTHAIAIKQIQEVPQK
jgi:DNA/RNA endonuclease YhcR with UshA esterase domain